MVAEAAEIFVMETSVFWPAYERLLGVEVDVKEVLSELPGKESPASPRPALDVES
jgi:hypothetical protein